MALTYTPQLRKALIKRRPNGGKTKTGAKVAGWNVQQFGQAYDSMTNNGATGCTDTILQWLVYLWKGSKPTHNSIRRAAGNPPYSRGLYASEVQRVIAHYGLPYAVRYSLTPKELRAAAKLGPVGFGHVYGWWPDWYRYRLGGSATDGRPNGFASPRGEAGKTQSTWSGAHFGLLLGVATSPTETDKVYAWEPNHGSASRPEKPAYDVMTVAQLDAVYLSYQRLGRSLYAIVPTRELPAAGF